MFTNKLLLILLSIFLSSCGSFYNKQDLIPICLYPDEFLNVAPNWICPDIFPVQNTISSIDYSDISLSGLDFMDKAATRSSNINLSYKLRFIISNKIETSLLKLGFSNENIDIISAILTSDINHIKLSSYTSQHKISSKSGKFFVLTSIHYDLANKFINDYISKNKDLKKYFKSQSDIELFLNTLLFK